MLKRVHINTGFSHTFNLFIRANLMLFALCFVFYSTDSSGVALGSLVLCSKFNGKLLQQDDRPVSNVTITRRWQWGWNDQTGEESVNSDAEGNFSFPQVNGSSFTARLLPHEPGIRTEIVAITDAGEVTLFSVQKKNYDIDGELENQALQGPGINLHCYVDKKPNAEGPFWGTCKQP